jgi:hypothetical protein
VRHAITLLLLVALGGCFESDEERAARAYTERDYGTAQELAQGLAAENNPRGFDLLALMAAQGMGRQVDFQQAFAHAERAIALDAGYASTRDAILSRIDHNMASAQGNFDDGNYARALSLAEPLGAYGHEAAAILVNTLITGHYVALPGSAMSWRDYWDRCSGNIRREDNDQADATFAEECLGKTIVWDGHVVRATDQALTIKMRPGRPASRNDLTLKLDAPPDRAVANNGRKIRFAGTIDARGNPNRPDLLVAGAVIGPAPLTRDEQAREVELDRHIVIGGCQILVEELYRAEHMPQWAIETEARVLEGGSPRSRAFSLLVGILSESKVFNRGEDGAWLSIFDGTVTIQSVVARTAQVTKFTAECAMDSVYRKGDVPSEHGSLRFVTIAEPVVDSAPDRMRD